MGVSRDMTCHFYPGRMAGSGIVGGGGVSGYCTGAFSGITGAGVDPNLGVHWRALAGHLKCLDFAAAHAVGVGGVT